MSAQSLLIIGGGIAGLAVGCYGQMNGYRTQIVEMAETPGGLCTAWTRAGYTFNGCLRALPGSRFGAGFNNIWRELGALQGRRIVNHEEYLRIEGKDGRAVRLFTNVDRLERHLQELAPQDADLIARYARALRHMAQFDLPMDEARELFGPREVLRLVVAAAPYLDDMVRYSHTSLPQFARQLKEPLLREAFSVVSDDLARGPVTAMFMIGQDLQNQNAGYPIGGSLAFSRAIARRYLALGGDITYGAAVERILVERGRAIGARLRDGSERRADIVISAADGHATIFDLLGGQHLDDEIIERYERLPTTTPYVQVSLGVARDLSEEPHDVNMPLETPFRVAGEWRERMEYRHYGFDPSLAPAGKSALTVQFPSDYDYWKACARDGARYQREKQTVAQAVVAALDQRFPGLERQVEVVDVATPLTYERLTGAWRGSPKGWQVTRQTLEMMMGRGIERTLPGLANFYMAGHWVEPVGGVCTAAFSGRSVIQILCHQAGREFVATLPEDDEQGA